MSLRHAVLGLLAERPASGYDLMKLFETSLANVWPATQSQVYGEMGKLATAGLLTVSAEGPRGRKEYAITDQGLAELRHWLTETEPERVRRSETLLRHQLPALLRPLQPGRDPVHPGGRGCRAALHHGHHRSRCGEALRDARAHPP